MDCKKINPLILKYIEGKISISDEQILREHTRNCPICRAELELYKSIRAEETAEIEIPESFDRNVMNMLDKGFNFNTLRLKLCYGLFAVFSVGTGLFLMLSQRGLSEIFRCFGSKKYTVYAENIERVFFDIKMYAIRNIEMLESELQSVIDGFETASFFVFIFIWVIIIGYMIHTSK